MKFLYFFFICSFDRSSRRHRDRSKRKSPKPTRHNRHRDDRSHSTSRRRHKERKEREDRTPVKVKTFHFILYFLFFKLKVVKKCLKTKGRNRRYCKRKIAKNHSKSHPNYKTEQCNYCIWGKFGSNPIHSKMSPWYEPENIVSL